MLRPTAAEKEVARHTADLLLLNHEGDVVTSERMLSWEVWARLGDAVRAFRSEHGYTPIIRWRTRDGRVTRLDAPE